MGLRPPLVGSTSYTTAAPIMRAQSGVAITLKPAGDAGQGAWNLTDLGAGGYGIHINAGQGNTEQALIGVGMDYGTAGGILISMKNTGAGLNIAQNPQAFGPAIKVDGYSTHERPLKVTNFVGGLPSQIISGKGQAFEDGVANGSTTFTSATATFTANDVGAAISQLTSTATTPSVIPAGTTIASVTNATTVVLSQAATGSASSIPFFIGTGGVAVRAPAASQSLLDVKAGVTGQAIINVYDNQTDTQPTMYFQSSGIINFGPGGSSSVDTYVRRWSNGIARVGSFSVTNPGLKIGGGSIIFSGSGAPSSIANSNDGDIYLRTDTPGSANQRVYVRAAGSWTGIL